MSKTIKKYLNYKEDSKGRVTFIDNTKDTYFENIFRESSDKKVVEFYNILQKMSPRDREKQLQIAFDMEIKDLFYSNYREKMHIAENLKTIFSRYKMMYKRSEYMADTFLANIYEKMKIDGRFKKIL